MKSAYMIAALLFAATPALAVDDQCLPGTACLQAHPLTARPQPVLQQPAAPSGIPVRDINLVDAMAQQQQAIAALQAVMAQMLVIQQAIYGEMIKIQATIATPQHVSALAADTP